MIQYLQSSFNTGQASTQYKQKDKNVASGAAAGLQLWLEMGGRNVPQGRAICDIVKATNTTYNRRRISTYDEVLNATDFEVVHLPPPEHVPVHFPHVSLRDCNRSDLLEQKSKKQWILWGAQNKVIDSKVRRDHCLSMLTNNPIRETVPDIPLFLVKAENVHVTEHGVVQARNENLAWKRQCFGSSRIAEINETCQCKNEVDTVFVAVNWWGDHTGHFLGETLPRLVSYLEFSQQMPVLLPSEKGNTSQISTWLNYFNIKGLWGSTCARKALVASPSDCRQGSYMKNMILKTREQLNLEYHPHRVTILWRDSDKRRREPIRDADGLKQSLEEAGYLHVDIVHSSNSTLWSCIDCQLDIFRNTWLFIASHGAGIMNLQFMAANTSVVEIASADRPEEPIYSNLEQRARLLGQHFYHYYWHDEKEKTELNATAFVEELVEFSPPIAQPRSYHQVPQKVF